MLGAEVFFLVLPFIVMSVLGTGLFLVFRERAAAVRARRQLVEPDLSAPVRDPREPARPWWANTWLWLGIGVASILLGVFVWPGLFGGTFLFIPLVWIRRPRPSSKMDPRTNGHAKHGSLD